MTSLTPLLLLLLLLLIVLLVLFVQQFELSIFSDVIVDTSLQQSCHLQFTQVFSTVNLSWPQVINLLH